MWSQSYRTCPNCGSPVRHIGASGVCARCLLEVGLSESTTTWQAESRPQGRTEAGRALGRVGRYDLIQEIAHGGMGVVYRALDLSLNRVVALKLMLGGQFASEKEVNRFRAEAAAAARLDHPNIVPIHEAGEESGRLFYTMKFMEGGALSQHLKAGRVPPPGWSAQIVAKIARAAHHAHQQGILHRDLKPGNVLLDADGEPHLSDFGLAKWLDGAGGITFSGATLGSPSYMSPEQAAGDPGRLTAASDTYSLGALLYHLLTRHAPFEAATPLATMDRVRRQEPVRPSALNPVVDPGLEIICLKCLEKEPAKRYESAAALAEDLERWLHHQPLHARPAGTISRLAKWARRNSGNSTLLVMSSLAASILLVSQSITGVCLARAKMKLRFANEQLNGSGARLERHISQDSDGAISQCYGPQAIRRGTGAATLQCVDVLDQPSR